MTLGKCYQPKPKAEADNRWKSDSSVDGETRIIVGKRGNKNRIIIIIIVLLYIVLKKITTNAFSQRSQFIFKHLKMYN